MSPQELERLARRRILWVSHGYGYGGDLMYFGEIFRHFRMLVPDMGVVVDQATRFLNPYQIRLLPLMRVWRHPLRRKNPDGQVYETELAMPSPTLVARLAGQRADVLIVIEFTLPALMATLLATISRRTRLVLLIESDPASRGASSNPIVLRIKRWATGRADIIQTNNERGRRYIVEDLRADPGKVRVAPYLTSRPPGPARQVKAKIGPLRMLFANSITARKGLRQLLDALAALDPGLRANVALTVVGDGPERSELEQRVATLDMGDRLTFVGKRSYGDLGPFYADADVLAMPSLADYRSLAGFEGLAYGLALLSSRHDGATEETVRDGINGFVIDPLDTAELADRIGILIRDRELVLGMQHASQALYDECFSLDAIAMNIATSAAIATRSR